MKSKDERTAEAIRILQEAPPIRVQITSSSTGVLIQRARDFVRLASR